MHILHHEQLIGCITDLANRGHFAVRKNVFINPGVGVGIPKILADGMQQEQAEMMMKKVHESSHKTIIAGDFNNTAFSYIYEMINDDGRFKDAFLESGEGFGQTFKLNYFPLRIDFMFFDSGIQINSYERFKNDFSDHFPVMTRFKI